MRTKHYLFSLLPLAASAILAACSSSEAEESVSDLTDMELATKALLVMGTSLNGVPNTDGVCTQCHNHDANNQGTFIRWAASYRSAMAILQDETKSKEERINLLRTDPNDSKSHFDTQKLGILTAGAHLGLGPNVLPDRHPNTYAQNKMLAELFAGRDAEYEQFRNDTLMPMSVQYDRLSPGQYEAVLTWMQKGLPELKTLISDEGRPTSCVEDFSKLKDHATKVRPRSWATINKEARIKMFACSPDAAPVDCFKQQVGGKPVFPDVETIDVGAKWTKRFGTVRVAQDLGELRTSFWSRTSSDGRFFAVGGRPSLIIDLAAALDPAGAHVRQIKVSAPFDPDFFPGNQAFMYQSTGVGGAAICAQSLLERADVTEVTFNEPECSKLERTALYQTVAQAQGDNAFSDIFVINNANAADNPASTGAYDKNPNAGPQASAEIAVAVSLGTESGYKTTQKASIPLPFHGDTMASRSLSLLGSRISGKDAPLGYAITRVTSVQTADGYQFSGNDVGRICMPGNKANFSFDERFLVTHHYLTREDFTSDDAFAPYKAAGGSEILLADFVTGKKITVLRTAPGQYALFPHFRSDGWIMFEVRDSIAKKTMIMAADAAIRATIADPTP